MLLGVVLFSPGYVLSTSKGAVLENMVVESVVQSQATNSANEVQYNSLADNISTTKAQGYSHVYHFSSSRFWYHQISLATRAIT